MGTRKRGVSSALAVFLLALAAFSCGDSADIGSQIGGTWERHIMSEEGSFEGSLTFGPGYTFEFTFNGEVRGHERSAGKYKISGRDITFEDPSCGGAGRYRFLVKHDVLSFIPLGDGCGKRKTVLTGEWKRRGVPQPDTD
ncbi:MAG: hypothetical protein AB1598_14100 [Thermodesulfobacteriota bacterium]